MSMDKTTTDALLWALGLVVAPLASGVVSGWGLSGIEARFKKWRYKSRKMRRLQLEWKPQDLWVGVYYTNSAYQFDVWICLLPCLPIHWAHVHKQKDSAG